MEYLSYRYHIDFRIDLKEIEIFKNSTRSGDSCENSKRF